jgi:hypothetical protein
MRTIWARSVLTAPDRSRSIAGKSLRASYFSQTIAIILSAWFVLAPGLVAAPAEVPTPARAGGLVVATDPPGARVFVDGELAGVTPLVVDRVSEGAHRVRVSKTGYLDNARVIGVEPGRSSALRVTLTPSTTPPSRADAQSGTGHSSTPVFRNPWVIGAAVGSAAALVLLLRQNQAPSVSSIAVAPDGTAMAGVTPIRFQATTTDPDGDTLAYTWNFGDGTADSHLESPAHTYAVPGTYVVAFSVSDGHDAVDATKSVTVGPSLAGNWSGGVDPVFGCPVTLVLTQSPDTLGGTVSIGGICNASVALQTGSVSPLAHPATVTWQTASYSNTVQGTSYVGINLSFTGHTAGDGRSLSGTLTENQPSFNLSIPLAVTFNK